MKYQVLNPSSIPSYIETISEVVSVLGENRRLEIEEVGDGNLNYVFKIRNLNNPGAEVVLKQAVPYLRMVGEEWPLSRDRMRYEIRALKIYNELTPEHVPQIYFADEEMSLVIMQCLSEHVILRYGMIEGTVYPNVVGHITTFLAETLFKTSSLCLESEKKRELMSQFTMNAELCKLTENFIFSFPYMEHDSNYSNPKTDEYLQEWRRDSDYKKQVLKFKDLFMNKADALLHGDVHTGSLMVSQEQSFVIDMEFAFFGPFSFDVGKLMGNYMLAYTSHFYHSSDGTYQAWLLDSIVEIWRQFHSKFLALWESQNESALILNGYLSEQELEKAPLIYKTLKDVVFALQQGNDFDSTIEQAQERLQKGGFIVDYLTLCRESDLKCATSEDARLVLLVAAYLGTARLIDNLAFPLNRAND